MSALTSLPVNIVSGNFEVAPETRSNGQVVLTLVEVNY